MVVKRDFDKILVNLLRKDPNIMNIALIDAEGMPISFALKSRKYQIKPATLGSKTKVLLYLSKNFANSIQITSPIYQIFFFKKIALMIVNLKVVNFFVLYDMKGWPIDGKMLYELFNNVKRLLMDVEKSKDTELKAIFEGEQKGVKISDISDTFLKIIAKNINSLNKIAVKPFTVKKGEINLIKDDQNSYSAYLKAKLENPKIIEGVSVKDDNAVLFNLDNTGEQFKTGVGTLIKTLYDELDTFNLGKPLWIINIFEKSELLFLSRLGKVGTSNIQTALLMENRLGNISELVNIIYNLALEMNAVLPDENLKDLAQQLEYIGFSMSDLTLSIEKSLIKNEGERTEMLLERGATLYESEGKFSEAGQFYGKLGEIYFKNGENTKAEQQLTVAAELHLKGKNYEKAGDVYSYLGSMAKKEGDSNKSFSNFTIAQKYYKSSGSKAKLQKVNIEIKAMKDSLKGDLSQYLMTATGESIPFSFLEKKFSLSEKVLIDLFKDLFDTSELSGQINLIKKRYTKKRYGSNEAIVGDQGIAGKAYEMPEINKSILIQKERTLEKQLVQIEDTFEHINFPFEKYIDYQDKILELNFINQTTSILSRNLESSQCIICFKNFTKKDQICDCSNGHFYHHNCMKLWLENQKKCPICEVDILDNLKLFYLDTLQVKDDLISLQDIIGTLKSKIKNLETSLEKREEQIYLMKDYSNKDKNIFEKLLVERDSKHMVERELKKSNKLIQELRSLLEMIKK